MADEPDQIPTGTLQLPDIYKPLCLVSRSIFKSGDTVAEDVANCVHDDSIIRNGIAQRNLDVRVLRLPDHMIRKAVFRTKRIAQVILPRAEPLSSEVLDDHHAVYLSTGVKYDKMRQEMKGIHSAPSRKLKFKALPEGMRFIDCLSDLIKVVAIPTGDVEYVTLSYVWGAPRAEEAASPTNDVQNVPLTIRDAMVVVRELGLRYLWVDKYCIEDSNKHIMISRMDNIYKAARLTIVAASGDDAFHGIPGVSRMYHLECNGSIIYFQDPEDEIKASRWSTRGWTYQEGVLSSCCLIFTSTQWVWKIGHEMVSKTRLTTIPRSPISRTSHPKELYILNAINSYAFRDLTYPSDSLSAFLGVLKNWQSPILSHLSGVPFGKTSHRFFALFLHGIFWGCRRTNLVRVSSIPSWTWAGWRGFSEKDGPYSMFTFEESLPMCSETANVHVHVDRHYSLRKYLEFIPKINENNRNNHLVDKIQISGWSVRLDSEQLSDFQVHWDSLEFRDQHRGNPLVLLVLSWQSRSGADRRWRLLVLGKRPGADNLYHRLGRVVWHAPIGLDPKDIVIDGQGSEWRSFTLV